MRRRAVAALVVAMSLPTAAQARDYCSTRPSLGQSACVLDPGRVAIEAALTDWERDDDSDTLLIGDTLLRIGLTNRIETQVGWTPVGIARARDDGRRITRSGDATVGARINLHRPDGTGLSYGLQPSITVPVGRAPIGDPGWSASLIAPVSFDLNDRVQAQFSPELRVVGDDARYRTEPSAVVGLEIELTKAVSATAELQWQHAEHRDMANGALSLAWGLSGDLFLDTGTVIGLNAAAPAIRCYTGISRRF